MNGISSKNYFPIKTLISISAPRDQLRSNLNLSSTLQSNTDAVKLSIYKNNNYLDNYEFADTTKEYRVNTKTVEIPDGYFKESVKQVNQYSRRTLSISILTDEGDKISVSSDAFENMSRTIYSNNGQTGILHGDYNSSGNVEGNINETEESDFSSVLSKAKNILDLSVKVGAGEISEQDLLNAIAEFGSGNVDNNSLSSVQINIDVDSATGQEEYDVILPQSDLTEEEQYVYAPEADQTEIVTQSKTKVATSDPKINSFKIALTDYYQSLFDSVESGKGDNMSDFLSRTFKQLINLQMDILSSNKSLYPTDSLENKDTNTIEE